jgi:hypothetical protein
MGEKDPVPTGLAAAGEPIPDPIGDPMGLPPMGDGPIDDPAFLGATEAPTVIPA